MKGLQPFTLLWHPEQSLIPQALNFQLEPLILVVQQELSHLRLQRSSTMKQPKHTQATDSPAEESASVTLTVSVTDLSSTPTFTEPPFCGTVSTGDASGTTVGTYAASVADPQETATYTFASGNTATKFAVSSAGLVTTASAVTASDSFPYLLVLKATASVTTASTATATLTVVRDDTCSGATDHKSIAMATAGTLLLLIVSRIV